MNCRRITTRGLNFVSVKLGLFVFVILCIAVNYIVVDDYQLDYRKYLTPRLNTRSSGLNERSPHPNESSSHLNDSSSHLNERSPHLNKSSSHLNESSSRPNNRSSRPNERSYRLNVTSFMLYTEGCKIPSFDPYHPQLSHYFGLNEKIITCSDEPPLTYQENLTLKINESVRDAIPNFAKCHHEAIHRVSGTDEKVSYSNPVVFIQNINVSEEFLRVSCFDKAGLKIYRNYHAFILPKPKILDTLKQRNKERRVKDASKEILNVMMVGIDSLSRYNHIVKMPKTRDFLLTNLSAIELTGYNKVADNTLLNLTPLLTGKYLLEEFKRLDISHDDFVDELDFVFKNYSKKGYSVLFAEEVGAIYNYVARGFNSSPADYFLRPFSLSLDQDHSVWPNRFCVKDRPQTHVVLDYSLDFMQRIKDEPKFSFTFNARLSHDSIPLLSTADKYYYEFLLKTLKSGILNNTVMIMFGDHGFRYGPIRQTAYGKMQSRLPLMYVVFPSWFSKKYPEIYRNVVTNSKRLTTPFDIHALLEDILHFTGVPRKTCSVDQRGISLFDCIPESRSCEDAHIPPHYCTCQYEVVDGFTIRDEIIQKTSKYVLNLINEHISPLTKCPRLNLSSIISAKVLKTDLTSYITYQDIMRKSDAKWQEKDRLMIKITLKTTPGGGEFDTTVMYKLKQKEMFATLNSVERIDEYGDSGDCVVPLFRPYCYCNFK